MLPRLLLIDLTCTGDGSATGELKSALFAEWPRDRFLQVFSAGGGRLGTLSEEGAQTFTENDAAVSERIDAFAAEVVLYRPTPNTPKLHALALSTIDRLGVPVVTWIMDDWPSAYAKEDPTAASALDADWRALLASSAARLSISQPMSEAFAARYGCAFEAVANGVAQSDWPEAVRRDPLGPLKVRYAGSLAENMTLRSVRLIAEAVDRLITAGGDICFEIKTRPHWEALARPIFEGLKGVSFQTDELEPAAYRGWLCDADIVTIAYNFDPSSREYVQYSLANKLPECLASGAPLLAVGPEVAATLKALSDYDCGERVTTDDPDAVVAALAKLAKSTDLRLESARKAQSVAFQHFLLSDQQKRLERVVRDAAWSLAAPHGYPREAGAHVDEAEVIAGLLQERKGRSHVMLDIGAHVGGAAVLFDRLGWRVHCFEPDPENRARLTKEFTGVANVVIDARAVSDESSKAVPFYTSTESTGISGLNAFHKTHRESHAVDVTTVSEIVAEFGIDRIDFLKTDVEGFDFSVLKGAPWETIKPDVVVCEFEDSKTVPLGHRWRDIADFLAARGYAVYVSEWHKVLRYGAAHDWRRVSAFSEADPQAEAWGNLLAFREDPGLATVLDAFQGALVFRGRRSGDRGFANVREKRSYYTTLAERLYKISPAAYGVTRRAVRLGRRVLGRRTSSRL